MDTQSPLISQIEKMRPDVLRIQGQVISAIKTHLTENGIDLPFPTQRVLFQDQTEVTDGDRARQREGWPAGRKTPPLPARSVRVMDSKEA